MSNQKIIDSIILAEGEIFTNRPTDRGGPTKFGITLKIYQALKPTATLQDLVKMERLEAEGIYEAEYIKPFEELQEPLKTTAIHTGVLRGQRTAIRMLQGLLGLPQDGIIGPKTLASIETLGSSKWNELFIGAMLHHFAIEVNKDPLQKANWVGWRNRMLSLI